jgi:hypothetical protein
MAYTAGNLVLTGSHNGYGRYRYDTTDASTAVDASGYFDNSDDDLNLAVGDIIDVVVWATAVRTGTISDVAQHIVVSVSAAGVVDLSDDLLGATVADSD